MLVQGAELATCPEQPVHIGNLHNLHLVVSKVLKETEISYLSSEKHLNILEHTPKKQDELIQMQMAVLHGEILILQELKWMADASYGK